MKLLDALHVLNEKKMASSNMEYLLNPMGQELLTFLKSVRGHEARGYVDTKGNVFVWNAHQAIHDSFVGFMIQDGMMDSQEREYTSGIDMKTMEMVKILRLFFSLTKQTKSESSWGYYGFQVGPVWVSAYNLKNPSDGGPRSFNTQSIMGWSERMDFLINRLKAIPVPTPPEPPRMDPARAQAMLDELPTGFR